MPHNAHSHSQVVAHTDTAPAPVDTPPEPKRPATGFWLAVFAYAILYYFSISPLNPLLWVLAFLVIPVLTGLIGWRQGAPVGAGSRFATKLRAAGIPMAIFTAISLMIAHSRVGPSFSPIATFWVGLFVSIVYGFLAGIVAGFTALLYARIRG